MLARLLLTSTSSRPSGALVMLVRGCLWRASSVFESLLIESASDPSSEAALLPQRTGQNVLIPVHRWLDVRSDPAEIDLLVESAAAAGDFSLTLHGAGREDARIAPATAAELALAAVQVVTRCQRFLPLVNAHSSCALFERVLLAHREAHDLSKPLVQADFAHSLDTQRWVLRLEPQASLAVQLAALLHDVERLVTESDRRIEHHAEDYVAFKRAHAESGAILARRLLRAAGAPAQLATRVSELVSSHERPGADAELALLNEADALSFFSLNASGFVRYYPIAHTLKKVRYTLGRLGDRGRAQLPSIRHPPQIRALLTNAVSTPMETAHHD